MTDYFNNLQTWLGRATRLCILLIASGCHTSQSDLASPDTDLAPIRIEHPGQLGVFKSTEKIQVPVSVINDSSEEIHLELLTLSCGCMSADFKPSILPAGGRYDFHVSIFNAALGDGWQHGIIKTNSPNFSELKFQVLYRIEPSTYLFPDKFLLDSEWLKGKEWPLPVEYKIEALDSRVELVKPIYIEPAPNNYRSLSLKYSIPSDTTFEPGGTILLRAEKGDFGGGYMDDAFVIVVEGQGGALRFPVSVSGFIPYD